MLARLHGVGQTKQPDFGLNMPAVVKGGALIGVLTSGVVIAHLAALGFSGIFLFLRYGTGYSRGETIMLTVMTLIALLAVAAVGLVMWSSRHGKLLMRTRVIADLNLDGDEQVLDVGCGNGLLLLGVAEQLTSGRATGVDLWRADLESHNSADSVRRNATLAGVADRVEVHDADAQDLPFGDAAFDVVLSSFMLHHMRQDARERAVSEMLRTLKPGGRLVIVEILHRAELRRLLLAAGATSVDEPSLGLPLYKRLVAIK